MDAPIVIKANLDVQTFEITTDVIFDLISGVKPPRVRVVYSSLFDSVT